MASADHDLEVHLIGRHLNGVDEVERRVVPTLGLAEQVEIGRDLVRPFPHDHLPVPPQAEPRKVAGRRNTHTLQRDRGRRGRPEIRDSHAENALPQIARREERQRRPP